MLVACNCDYGCPCNFNALPTTGKCEGHWTWHVEEGTYGDVSLDDLNFTVAVDWPGPIHEGNGKALILVDERADEAQRQNDRDAGGRRGRRAVGRARLDMADRRRAAPCPVRALAGRVSWRVRAADYLEIESEPIRNPVTGAEVHPGAVLPEGIVFKQGEFGSSRTFRISNGIELEHPGKYTAIAQFEYAGP